jgi:hypothetical protein
MLLDRLELREELRQDYAELLPALDPADWRRLRGEQELLCRHAQDLALATLPGLLVDAAERRRFLALVDRLAGDARLQGMVLSAEQKAMAARLRQLLRAPVGRKRVAAKTARPVRRAQPAPAPARPDPARAKTARTKTARTKTSRAGR